MIKKTVGIFLAVMVSLSAVTSASAQGPLDAMDEALIEFGLPEEKIDNLPPALAEELYNMALQGYKLDSITTTYTYGMRNAAGSPSDRRLLSYLSRPSISGTSKHSQHHD